MKHIIISFLFILMTVSVKAQDVDFQKRNISLIILDKKERPMSSIIVSSIGATETGSTNRSGLFVFNDMSDSDTLYVLLPRIGEVYIPVVGMDSIVVKLRSARSYYYVSNNGQSENFSRMSENYNAIKTEPTDLLDVQAMMSKNQYRSLVDLLQGIAGLTIITNSDGSVSANMRGPTSIFGANEAIVVLDGSVIGTLSRAENMINIYDIKTIEVQKNATQWGTFGADGVILIKTK